MKRRPILNIAPDDGFLDIVFETTILVLFTLVAMCMIGLFAFLLVAGATELVRWVF